MTDEVKERAKELARRDGLGEDHVHVLSTGVRVLLKPVSSMLIEDMRAAIPIPDVPIWHNEDKGRDEENPNDPKYLQAVQDAQARRGAVTLDALALFGVDLADGMPEDDTWLKKLKMLERLGHLSLRNYDLEDTFEREFLYKRWVAISQADYGLLMTLASSVPASEVRRARRSFLGDKEPDAD